MFWVLAVSVATVIMPTAATGQPVPPIALFLGVLIFQPEAISHSFPAGAASLAICQGVWVVDGARKGNLKEI